MDLQLKNKVSLVKASTPRIGYGIAKLLAAGGSTVILNRRKPEDVDVINSLI